MIKIVLINKELLIRTICLTLVISFLMSQAAKISPLVLGIHVLLMQFFTWASYGIDGFAFATEALVGNFFGSKSTEKLRTVIQKAFLQTRILSLFCSVTFLFGFERIVSLFSDRPDIEQPASNYKLIVILLPLMAYSSFIWDGIGVGLTAVKEMRKSMIFSAITFFVAFFILDRFESVNLTTIWSIFLGFLVLRAISLSRLLKPHLNS